MHVPKEIKIILRLFLVIAMYCQGSSSQIKSVTQPLLLLASWEGSLSTSNSLETTYILFELPCIPNKFCVPSYFYKASTQTNNNDTDYVLIMY